MIAGGRAIDDTETVEEHHSSPEAYRLSFGITRSTITSSLGVLPSSRCCGIRSVAINYGLYAYSI